MIPNESKLVFVLSFLLTVAFLAASAQSQPAQQPQGQSKEDKTAEEEALRHAEYVEVTATRVPELVAAHEIVHAITPGFPHTPEGLMVAHLTRGDLRGNDLRLSASAAAAFHYALKLRDQANTKP